MYHPHGATQLQGLRNIFLASVSPHWSEVSQSQTSEMWKRKLFDSNVEETKSKLGKGIDLDKESHEPGSWQRETVIKWTKKLGLADRNLRTETGM